MLDPLLPLHEFQEAFAPIGSRIDAGLTAQLQARLFGVYIFVCVCVCKRKSETRTTTAHPQPTSQKKQNQATPSPSSLPRPPPNHVMQELAEGYRQRAEGRAPTHLHLIDEFPALAILQVEERYGCNVYVGR